MKPRSRTEIFASSSATSLPFRKTLLMTCLSLLQPQPQCIPGTAENTRFAHRLEREQRILAERPALEADLERADALVLRQRGDEGLLRHHLRLQLLRLAFGDRYQQVVLQAGLHGLRRALPDFERFDLFARLVQPHAVEELE